MNWNVSFAFVYLFEWVLLTFLAALCRLLWSVCYLFYVNFGIVMKPEVCHFSDAIEDGYVQCSYLRVNDEFGTIKWSPCGGRRIKRSNLNTEYIHSTLLSGEGIVSNLLIKWYHVPVGHGGRGHTFNKN